jgi:hypothetical protein
MSEPNLHPVSAGGVSARTRKKLSPGAAAVLGTPSEGL